jgi:hypothetical protein
MHPVAAASEALRALVALCLKADVGHYLHELQRFVRYVYENPSLRRCADELDQETRQWYARFSDEHLLLTNEIRELMGKYPSLFPSDPSSDQVDRTIEDVLSYRQLLRELGELLASQDMRPALFVEGDPSWDRTINGRAVQLLDRCMQRVPISLPPSESAPTENTSPDGPPPQSAPPKASYSELRSRITELFACTNQLHLRRLNSLQTEAGLMWTTVLETVRTVESAQADSAEDPLSRAMRIRDTAVVKVAYGSGSTFQHFKPSELQTGHVQNLMQAQKLLLERLLADFEIRLRTRASSEWLIRRYAFRSTCFARSYLLGLVKKSKKRSETVLVEDAARFLTEQGVDVDPQRVLGARRLDLYEEYSKDFARDVILIEGKVLRNGSNALRAVTAGIAQLLDYATFAQSHGKRTENFLLVYLRSPDKISVPREAILFGEYLAQVVVVDLSDAAESGSRTQRVITLASDDIVREVAQRRARTQRRAKTKAPAHSAARLSPWR